ncbi:MAG: glucokinase [Deltaproteobacteria bacterium]|nr:glucokinase [Deltaproteobacteria bacterium]
MLLAGDIGGTKTRLGIFSTGGNDAQPPQPLAEMTFENARYPDLETIVREFIGQVKAGKVERACFGVAGPVLGDRVAITNLPWLIDGKKLAAALNIPSVGIINDLLATAHALPFLPPEDLRTLNRGKPVPQGNMAVIAAGTGLGEAFLIWDGRRYQSYASEGGHGDFAPNNGTETELLRHLSQRWGHVSYDRVCTGRGLPDIYRFLKENDPADDLPGLAERVATAADATPLIVAAALAAEGRSLICVQALEIFVSTLGAEAGNMALRFMATGGIYVAGGLPPRILPFFNQPAFMDAFRRKGRLSEMVAQIPVHVVLNQAAPLLGAAYYARKTSPEAAI